MPIYEITLYCVYTATTLVSFLAGSRIEKKIEYWTKKKGRPLILTPREGARKSVHLFTAIIAGLLPFLTQNLYLPLILGIQFLVFLGAMDHFKEKLPRFGYLFKDRKGATYFALGYVLTALLYFEHPRVFFTSFAVLGLADPSASMIGMKYGVKKFLAKSLAGFFAHCLVSFTVVSSLEHFLFGTPLGVGFTIGILVALMSSLVECETGRGLDNILVPLFVASLLIDLHPIFHLAIK